MLQKLYPETFGGSSIGDSGMIRPGALISLIGYAFPPLYSVNTIGSYCTLSHQ